jgi:hypothetical protein
MNTFSFVMFEDFQIGIEWISIDMEMMDWATRADVISLIPAFCQ